MWNFIWKSKGLLQFQLKTRTCLKHFKNELNFCKEFCSEDKLYCGTNSCNTFSRSESGAETTSQTFQFLIDILNQNQVVEQFLQTFRPVYTPTCCWICYSCFFLNEKVLMLPVVYEKYNYLLSMNINAEIYKKKKNYRKEFFKMCPFINFFSSHWNK